MESQCHCLNRQLIKQKAINMVSQIKTAYMDRINTLQHELLLKDRRIEQIQLNIRKKDQITKQLISRKQEITNKLRSAEKQLESARIEIDKIERQKIIDDNEHSARQQQMSQVLMKLQRQMCNLKVNDAFNTSISSVSKLENSRYSIQISELFQKCPQQLIGFINSIEGQKPSDPKQIGDMICMLISKDGLSVQKYIEVHRTFLKRKIKEQQKKFRFILIYKPDKIKDKIKE